MIDKTVDSTETALAGIEDNSIILVSGFGDAGMPTELVEGVLDLGVRDLTIVSNNVGSGTGGLAALMKARRVRKMICSFPRTADSSVFDDLYRAGHIELEVVPQGTLAERMRAAGAGIGGFYTPTAYGTKLAEGKEQRLIDGRPHVFETPLHGDVALVKALKADRFGNLVYRKAARNFGPVMATAARLTVVQVSEIVPLGSLDPETVVTPGIFVNRVVAASPAVGDAT
ncbi:3-oxoacid CoA-transferase subunit A [Paraburkholderia sp. J12]|uniref:3-oxoacid CoA-transferase subunit A n=1 Tax=Paraburkholderia sp. J12 TaxID=2805432 RepID=UPI002ABD4524|nr:3-oxoacid CoA-transferase subunit A [Paraburkholderia sp. J12]